MRSAAKPVNLGVITPDDDQPRNAAVIVAHPDDETLWAGGTILNHPKWNWYIVALCRASDPDRSPRFHRAVHELGAAGSMADLDDGPDQSPLDMGLVRRTVLAALPSKHFALVLTHDPAGEYTRHVRHEETGRAVIELWQSGQLDAEELWTFAYEDGHKAYLPRAIEHADVRADLPAGVWAQKYALITGTYGFPADGFEARTTPRTEAFWRLSMPDEARSCSEMGGERS